jgi:ribosomal protein S18 acetylase RimI-like enzyme
VKDLVVRESWRGRGLGEALLRRALPVFAGRGESRLELKVHADNTSAIRLYERVGMRVVETLEGD